MRLCSASSSHNSVPLAVWMMIFPWKTLSRLVQALLCIFIFGKSPFFCPNFSSETSVVIFFSSMILLLLFLVSFSGEWTKWKWNQQQQKCILSKLECKSAFSPHWAIFHLRMCISSRFSFNRRKSNLQDIFAFSYLVGVFLLGPKRVYLHESFDTYEKLYRVSTIWRQRHTLWICWRMFLHKRKGR